MGTTRVIVVDPQKPSPEAVDEAAAILNAGGIIGFPTETVYGLAALITHRAAVERLRQLKERPQDKQFSVCIHSLAQAQRYAEFVPPLAQLLMQAFWPGPLTLVLPAGESGTVGLRLPSHPVAQMLLRRLAAPVFAPSANRSGEREPRTAQQVLQDFDGQIEAVLDAGPTPLGISSTVCRVDGDELQVLRRGAISEDQLREAGKRFTVLFVCTGNSCRSPMAEGFMRSLTQDNPRLRIESAGIAAMDGLPPSEYAVQAMARFAIDISGHRSRLLTDEMIRQASLILVMEDSHRQRILSRVPEAHDRVHVLTQYARKGAAPDAVMDPIGREPDVYVQTAALLKQLIERVVKHLV